jgi:putative ABC transport system permease protein
MLRRIILKSLWNRRLAVGLTVAGIALSTALILGVERVRMETRASFTSTIAGTDLIVGARTSPIQLLLYSVFGLGDPTNTVNWNSFEKISSHPSVAWAIPISLGDSHRGFRVLGTTPAYFEHLRFGNDRSLALREGALSDQPLSVIVGATVAQQLGYSIDTQIVIAHGSRDDGLSRHDNLPFNITGILTATGTPADRTIHVSLEGIEAIHTGWESGVPVAEDTLHADHLDAADLHTEAISAFFIGLEQRSQVLQFQRAINNFPEEPLLAILPGNALRELWQLFGNAELALVAVAGMTVLTGLLGMVVGIFSTLNERRREMAILRSVGARPADISALLMAESALIGMIGAMCGYLILTATALIIAATIGDGLGVSISAGLPSGREILLLGAVVVAAITAGTLPAWQAYRLSLHDGLSAGGG